MHARISQRRPLIAFAAAAFVVLAGVSAAQAAGPVGMSDAQARYQAERARCLSGESHQDRETCLREAGAALAEARRGTLSNEPESYAQNALQRCRLQPVEERDACIARMTGRGQVTGSVEGGGFVREYREIVVGEPDGEPATAFTPQTPAVQPDEPVHIIIVR